MNVNERELNTCVDVFDMFKIDNKNSAHNAMMLSYFAISDFKSCATAGDRNLSSAITIISAFCHLFFFFFLLTEFRPVLGFERKENPLYGHTLNPLTPNFIWNRRNTTLNTRRSKKSGLHLHSKTNSNIPAPPLRQHEA